jgi:hypothetical protein
MLGVVVYSRGRLGACTLVFIFRGCVVWGVGLAEGAPVLVGVWTMRQLMLTARRARSEERGVKFTDRPLAICVNNARSMTSDFLRTLRTT